VEKGLLFWGISCGVAARNTPKKHLSRTDDILFHGWNINLGFVEVKMDPRLLSDATLAASITRAASKQTYFTIRFLVDHSLVGDAFRAYAYFRWVDDWLDQETRPRTKRLAFIKRQQALLDGLLRGDLPANLTPEEKLLADLVQGDTEEDSGLRAYLRNMMAVMAFDADRRGRLISQRELNDYTLNLAQAVTEALHYFIGQDRSSPHGETRYLAVSGAHITHMLRDTLEDAEVGYYNIPREVVAANGIAPWDVKSLAYRNWVKERVHEARACFKAGRTYLAQVECLRCRIAGYAYIHRFEVVLDCIERDGFLLKSHYPERRGNGQGVKMIGWALWMALKNRYPGSGSSVLEGR
jgi:phytoene/squalene synthetase